MAKTAVPGTATSVALGKLKATNVSTVTPIEGSGAEVYVRDGKDRGRIVVRRQRSTFETTPPRAKAMKACRGLEGCEFKECLERGGIDAPRSIVTACNREEEGE